MKKFFGIFIILSTFAIPAVAFDCETNLEIKYMQSYKNHETYKQIYNDMKTSEQKKLEEYLNTPETKDHTTTCNGITYTIKKGESRREKIPTGAYGCIIRTGLFLEMDAKEEFLQQMKQQECNKTSEKSDNKSVEKNTADTTNNKTNTKQSDNKSVEKNTANTTNNKTNTKQEVKKEKEAKKAEQKAKKEQQKKEKEAAKKQLASDCATAGGKIIAGKCKCNDNKKIYDPDTKSCISKTANYDAAINILNKINSALDETMTKLSKKTQEEK